MDLLGSDQTGGNERQEEEDAAQARAKPAARHQGEASVIRKTVIRKNQNANKYGIKTNVRAIIFMKV
jgi:hypothetical protein